MSYFDEEDMQMLPPIALKRVANALGIDVAGKMLREVMSEILKRQTAYTVEKVGEIKKNILEAVRDNNLIAERKRKPIPKKEWKN